MGLNFLGMNIPTSAAELGTATHNDAVKTAGAILSPFYNGGAAIGGGAADFIHGLVTGHALGTAAAAAPAPAPAKGGSKQSGGNPDAGQTVTLGNGMTVTLPSAAFLKAHPATAAPQGQINDVGGSTQGGGSGKGSSSPGDDRPANAFDFVRQAALGNPNLTIGQLGTVADAASRLIPQKALVPKDQVIAQYSDLANRYAQMVAQDPNYAKTPGGQAHAALIQNLRSVVTPNPMFDINQALQQQQAAEQAQAQ